MDLCGILGSDGGTFIRCNMYPYTYVRHGWHPVSVASGWCTHAVCWLVCVGRWLCDLGCREVDMCGFSVCVVWPYKACCDTVY